MSKPRPLSRLAVRLDAVQGPRYNVDTYTHIGGDTMDEPLSMINLAIPHALKARLREYARRQEKSMKEVIVMALLAYLEEHDPQELRPRGK